MTMASKQNPTRNQTDLLSDLRERNVIKEAVQAYYGNIDAVMTEGTSERPWQTFELTQREDVTQWIADPRQIAKIQPNLVDFNQFVGQFREKVGVLDVGCYGGYFLDYLKRITFADLGDFSYVGIDIQERAVAAAQAAHPDEAEDTFRLGDVYSLAAQFGEESTDIAYCSRVLIHLPYFEDAVRNLYAVARRAVFLVVTMAPQSYVQKMRRRNLDTGHEEYYFFRYFSPEEIKNAAEPLGADYRIIHSRGPYASVILFK